MIRFASIICLSLFLALPANAQWSRNVERQGYPQDPVLEICESADHCMALGEAALQEKSTRIYSRIHKNKMYVEKAANMGSADAQYKLAELYEDDVDFKIRFEQWGTAAIPDNMVPYDQYELDAYTWYKVAHINGHPQANEKMEFMWEKIEDSYMVQRRMRHADTKAEKLNLLMSEVNTTVATKYEEGKALPRDYKAAFEYYKIAADAGNMAAQYELGFFYQFAFYVEEDRDIACEYFERAARIPRPEVIINLILTCNGGQYNREAAGHWLDKIKNTDHYWEVAQRLRKPPFIDKYVTNKERLKENFYYKKSNEFIKLAADDDHLKALSFLAMDQNDQTALNTLKELARTQSDAKLELLQYYISAEKTEERAELADEMIRDGHDDYLPHIVQHYRDLWDFKRANSIIRKHANQGNRWAMSKMVGINNRDPDQALIWAKKLADLGDYYPLCVVAINYKRNGDTEKAEKYYKIAAKHRQLQCSSWSMGELFMRDGDFEKALYYYQLAVAAGDLRQRNEIGDLYRFNFPEHEDHAEAEKWYLMGAELGDSSSMYSLALHHLMDTEDNIKAIMWHDIWYQFTSHWRYAGFPGDTIEYDPSNAPFTATKAKMPREDVAKAGEMAYKWMQENKVVTDALVARQIKDRKEYMTSQTDGTHALGFSALR